MWNFFKSRAAGVLGVTVYIIWKKISCMEDGRAGGCLGRRGGGRNIGYLSDDLVYKGL